MFSAIVKETQDWFKEYKSECIDCIGNVPLFQAVTAIRDDSDYMQWFTDGEHWFLCETTCFYTVLMKKDCYRKATLAELQERFKITLSQNNEHIERIK